MRWSEEGAGNEEAEAEKGNGRRTGVQVQHYLHICYASPTHIILLATGGARRARIMRWVEIP